MKIKMFKKNIINLSFSVVILSILPIFANAQTAESVIQKGISILQNVIPVIIGIALLLFLWGIVLYVIKDSDGDKAKARDYMLWGIISLFVMVSVWGLIGILVSTVFEGTNINEPPLYPTITGVSEGGSQTFAQVVGTVMELLLKGIVPFILTLSLIVFLWGIVKYISAGGSEVKIGEGIKLITYGLIGLFVMFAVWGLVGILIPFLGGESVLPQF